MIYDVDHVTTYEYGTRISFARCLLHLQPREEAHQRVLACALEIDPIPDESTQARDFFGNPICHVRFAAPHVSLVIRATARIRVEPVALPEPQATPAWNTIRAEAGQADLGGDSPVHHLFASRLVPHLPQVTAYAATSFPAGRPVLAGAMELNRRLNADFTYDPTATDVSTPISEVMRHRRGVCQDFAHLMIAGLRSLGIPAAYVSGYLRTQPPPGKERLAGADATHAWVAVWCGTKAGWIGLDPTNAIPAGVDHLVLARGRDYADVAPVSGVVVASAGHQVSVAVDVRPAGEDPPQALAG